MKRPALRLSFLVAVVMLAALFGWAFWPQEPDSNPHELSAADGRSRFWVTRYQYPLQPPNLTLLQRVSWQWYAFRHRHRNRNGAAYGFLPSPVQPHSISATLEQCMEITGTKYCVAVEISDTVDFGTTNTMTGTQWVAAFEHAIESNGPVNCFDYGKKHAFHDNLIVLHEGPGMVKIVPRSKLPEYRAAGLLEADVR